MYRVSQFVFVLFVIYNIQPIRTLPQGAPESVCDTMLPFHGGGIPPSTSRPPYRVVPHNIAVNQGQILRVEIEPQIPGKYKPVILYRKIDPHHSYCLIALFQLI